MGNYFSPTEQQFKLNRLIKSQKQCSICQEAYTDTNRPNLLQCGHLLCDECCDFTEQCVNCQNPVQVKTRFYGYVCILTSLRESGQIDPDRLIIIHFKIELQGIKQQQLFQEVKACSNLYSLIRKKLPSKIKSKPLLEFLAGQTFLFSKTGVSNIVRPYKWVLDAPFDKYADNEYLKNRITISQIEVNELLLRTAQAIS